MIEENNNNNIRINIIEDKWAKSCKYYLHPQSKQINYEISFNNRNYLNRKEETLNLNLVTWKRRRIFSRIWKRTFFFSSS